VGERLEQFLGNRQKPAVHRMGIALKKAPKALELLGDGGRVCYEQG
jgi:hypothetical protein